MKSSYLLQQLVNRDFKEKYKGSVLGVLWSVMVPLFMMLMYTYVFSEIFHLAWGEQPKSKYEYALVIFCGLSAFNMFSEVMTRSAGIVMGNVNYVKKVIFPLELLPLTVTITAFANCLISYGILLLGNLALSRTFYITSLELFLQFIPLFIACLGVAYALSSLAVYFRDIVNAISVMVMILMYVSPIFYSLETAPRQFQILAVINPLASVIENARRTCLYGEHMDLVGYLISLGSSVVIFVIGYMIFNRLKNGFADVL